MSNTNVGTALAQVADILSSSHYSDKEVFIIIPNITLADEAATEKYVQDFNTLSMFSLANEPGTLKFGAFQPRGEERSNQIFALEHFDSESSLARHRTSVPFHDMLSWLQNAKPNGIHLLPVPIPLQIMDCSFVRPSAKKTLDPFIVVTQIEFEAEEFSDVEAGIMEFGEEIKDIEDVLMFLPGKTEKETWIITVYRNKQSFEEKGFVQKRFTEGKKERSIRNWNEDFLELKVGYLSRS